MTRSKKQRPLQHERGDFGERFFAYKLPSAWVIHSYKGSEDYGLDYHVEVFTDGKPAGLEFGAQVRTVEKFASSSKVQTISLKKNNLLYMASKPYPLMLVIVSYSEKRAIFSWLQEVLSSEMLIKYLRDRNSSKRKIRVPLTTEYDLEDGGTQIESFLRRSKTVLISWLAKASHTQYILKLYLDIHAALDALIECTAVIHKKKRSEDEVSHKATYSFILTMMAYGVLYSITSRDEIASLGPAGPTILAICKQYRRVIKEMVSESEILKYEKTQKPLIVIPAKAKPFFPAVPRLLCILREALRTLAQILAPWRDFNIEMSGLAAHVIEFPQRSNIPVTQEKE